MAIQEIKVPDLEGAEDVAIIEVYVSVGDTVAEEDAIISLESDKAVMDMPSPLAGTITEIKVSEGDTVNAGDVVALADVGADGADPGETEAAESAEAPSDTSAKAPAEASPKAVPAEAPPSEKPAETAGPAASAPGTAPINAQEPGAQYHATPSVRQFAREIGVDLALITASGPKGRITREDLTGYVKRALSGKAPAGGGAAGGFSLPPIPTADFAAFGPVEEEPLSRIKKISGPHLHRNWVGVPHVTQFEEADITEVEAFRKRLNAENAEKGIKVSPLIFIIKAAVTSLKAFPNFNSSLGADGTTVIRKNYYHIGIAVDTPGGLMVPVVKDADKKGVVELAEELKDLSGRAREGKLKLDELQGGTFSISSLGGIGGTYFTPIVNAPEVAILGLSRSYMKPIWDGETFVPRLTLPFSVSYDHRVVDGAEGARFAVHLAGVISDMRRALI